MNHTTYDIPAAIYELGFIAAVFGIIIGPGAIAFGWATGFIGFEAAVIVLLLFAAYRPEVQS